MPTPGKHLDGDSLGGPVSHNIRYSKLKLLKEARIRIVSFSGWWVGDKRKKGWWSSTVNHQYFDDIKTEKLANGQILASR